MLMGMINLPITHYYIDRALLSHRLDRHHVRERGVWFLDPREKEDTVSGEKG